MPINPVNDQQINPVDDSQMIPVDLLSATTLWCGREITKLLNSPDYINRIDGVFKELLSNDVPAELKAPLTDTLAGLLIRENLGLEVQRRVASCLSEALQSWNVPVELKALLAEVLVKLASREDLEWYAYIDVAKGISAALRSTAVLRDLKNQLASALVTLAR